MRHDAAGNSPLPNAKEAAAQTISLIKRQFGQDEQHSSRTLFAVLAGMLVVLLGTVLLFLRMRDSV